MRRIILLATVAAVMAAMMILASTAFAQGNPSCFGEYARLPVPGGPGMVVSDVASSLAETGNTDDAAQLVGNAQQLRPCPPFETVP